MQHSSEIHNLQPTLFLPNNKQREINNLEVDTTYDLWVPRLIETYTTMDILLTCIFSAKKKFYSKVP